MFKASFWLTIKIPVLFHNLSEFDGYLLIQEFGKFDQKANVMECYQMVWKNIWLLC